MPGRTRTRWVVSTSRSGATLSGVRWTPSRRTSTSRVSPGRRLRQKGMRRRSRQSSSGRPGWSRWAPASRFLRRWRLGRHEAELSRSSRATCSRRLSTPRSPGTTASTSTSCRWFARPCAESKAPISRIGSILKGEHSSNESQSCRVAGFDDGLAGEGETMSGHSKWATTKHKKGVIDAKRGKLFAKMIKNIEVAARTGGGDVAGNPTLFDAIQRAKKLSVPNDNINNAVKRGSGATAGGADWQTITYEGYAPNGVAVLIECLTDNRNRAAAEVRTALARNGGQFADPGSVSYVFTRKGIVIVPKGDQSEDDLLEVVMDAGAEEINDLGEAFEIVSEPTDFVAVRSALQAAGIDYDSAEASFIPTLEIELDLDGARKMFRVIEALEDSDDVQNVWTNGDVSDEILAALDEDED